VMRVFRVAIPASQIGASRRFYEVLLGLEADDTVPSRLYFHCGDVIVAVIDWEVEPLGPFQPSPRTSTSRPKNWTRFMSERRPPERVSSLRSRSAHGASVRSTAPIQTATGSASWMTRRCLWVGVPLGHSHADLPMCAPISSARSVRTSNYRIIPSEAPLETRLDRCRSGRGPPRTGIMGGRRGPSAECPHGDSVS
jgi:hypothetical protein